MLSSSLNIYTDGACSPNPGRGGWGWLVLNADDVVHAESGGESNTTNNRMELTAILKALQAQENGSAPTIFSDSQYCIKGCTIWRKGWERNNFKRGKILNIDLWKLLRVEIDRVEPQFESVRGHCGNVGNEAADALADTGRMHIDLHHLENRGG